jgi:CheY-like chemotaxis protein
MGLILVADDDPSIRDIISRTLVAAGHEVVTEVDGAGALSRAQEIRPDVIVMDWMMPEMTGVNVCRAIRQIDPIHDTYIVISSAMTQADRVREAIEAGADDFMAKPFSPADLVKRIDAVLPAGSARHDHPAPSSPQVLVCAADGNVRADLAAAVATSGGQPIEVAEASELSQVGSEPDILLAIIADMSDVQTVQAVELVRRVDPEVPVILYLTPRERGHLGALPQQTSFMPVGDLQLLAAAAERAIARRTNIWADPPQATSSGSGDPGSAQGHAHQDR